MKYPKRFSAVLAFASLFLLLFTPWTFAQNVVTGDVAGTVTDPSGAVVPNAKVELKSSDYGFDKTVTTGPSGDFRFSLLKPGRYSLIVTTASFSKLTRDITVNLGQVTNASSSLAVGGSQTTVEVTSEAPLLQTDNANLTTTFDTRAVEELPNPGGDLTYYAQTAPGIAMNTSGGGYGNFSAFGLPATSNLFTENGNDENDPFLNLNNSGSSNLLLGKNEVQEVAVVTNGYTGQYGRMAGAAVNYTTKSGTNSFHGNATWDWNGSYLNANEWFNNHQGNPRPFANNNQWSASIGGPIKKNKTFFFVDTEGLRYVLPSTQNVYFPTPAFATATLANIGATQPAELPFYKQMMGLYQNSSAYSSLKPFSSSPAALGSGGDTTGGCEDLAGTGGFGAGNPCLGYFLASGKNLNKEWLLTGRLDQNIGSKDVLFGRYKMDHGQQPTSTDIVNNSLFGTSSNQPSYEGQLNETHTFSPNVVNSFIMSGMWYTAVFVRNSGEAAGFAALPYSTVEFGSNPMSSLGGTSVPDFIFPQGRNVTQYQGVDDISITKGRHELKFGVNYRRNDISDFDTQTFAGGLLNFGTMTDFYNGVVTAPADFFVQAFPAKNHVPLAIYSLGLYAQDTFKVTPNLTLTMALRADRNSNAVCQSNCYADTSTPFTSLSHDVTIPYNQAISTGLHSAFPNIEGIALQPRFGFSYNPAWAHNTVIRGGVGLFSDLYAGVLLDNMITNPPLDNTFTTFGGLAAPGVPNSVQSLASGSNASFLSGFNGGQTLAQITAANPFFSAPNIFSPAGTIQNPKYLEWNFQVEQQVGHADVLSLNYVGNHGYDLLVINPGLNLNSAGLPLTDVPATSPDPRFATVTGLSSTGISNYDGMVASYSHRFTHGLQAQVNYTWSHSLDDTSSLPSTPYSSATSVSTQLDPNCLRCLNYASSDMDIRHNFTANYVYDAPWKFGNSLLNQVLGGWQFSQTFYLRSGNPYSVIDSNEANDLSGTFTGGTVLATYLGGPTMSCSTPGIGLTPNQCLTAGMFSPSSTETSLGNLSRNAFRGPGYFNSDFNAMKVFSISERMKLRVGAHFFNVFNHPNFEAPVNNVADPSFGQILATVSPATSPYGSFQGAGVSGRLIQMEAHLQF